MEMVFGNPDEERVSEIACYQFPTITCFLTRDNVAFAEHILTKAKSIAHHFKFYHNHAGLWFNYQHRLLFRNGINLFIRIKTDHYLI